MADFTDILAFDIGGSAVKTAQVNPLTGLLKQELRTIAIPEFAGPEAVLDIIETVVRESNYRGPIGLGYPGVVRQGRIETAAHLSRSWIGLNPASMLLERLDCRTAVLNDCDAAGIAEMAFGAGKDRNRPKGGTVVVITLGSGIGTALFSDGHLFPNCELGHVELDGADAEITAAASIKARFELDWEDWGTRVDRYLAEIEKLLSPDRIIVGGAISDQYDQFRRYLRRRAELAPATFRNAAGVIGAAVAAHQAVAEQN